MEKYNDVWIRIQKNVCYRPIGIDEFIQDIEKTYRVQKRERWLPAACEDNELWISVFLNSPIMTLIRDAIATGMLFDIAKFAGGKLLNFFKSLELFASNNPQCFKLENMTFEFDDISIKFYGLKSNDIKTVGETFQLLTKELPRLQRLGINDIFSISLPIQEISSDRTQKYEISSYEWDYNPNLWLISAMNGCEKVIYNFKTHELIY